MNPIGIEIFGVIAVSTMALCYAGEARSPHFTLAFAGACLASSIYAALIESWPFMLIEVVWSGLALLRWKARVRPTWNRPTWNMRRM